jgi:hypothetical protein
MQDVVAYLMHVDGRHLQTVLNPAMHAHSQVLSAPSVNTEPSHSIQGNPRALVRAYSTGEYRCWLPRAITTERFPRN